MAPGISEDLRIQNACLWIRNEITLLWLNLLYVVTIASNRCRKTFQFKIDQDEEGKMCWAGKQHTHRLAPPLPTPTIFKCPLSALTPKSSRNSLMGLMMVRRSSSFLAQHGLCSVFDMNKLFWPPQQQGNLTLLTLRPRE